MRAFGTDPQGYVYVIDESNFCIQKLSDSQQLYLTHRGADKMAINQFEPADIAIDKQDITFM